jgi:hypothetical protein
MTTTTRAGTPGVENSARRDFLKSSSRLAGVLAAHSILGLLAPTLSWALELKHLAQTEADGVLMLAKTLYPHKDLPDAVYALVVKDIDDYATDSTALASVQAGIKSLNAQLGGEFTRASDDQRHDAVTRLIDSPFVQKVRGICITTLYNNEMAFAHFGYEGDAFSKGGYLLRGFSDLSWLANPPPDASPPFPA